MVHIYTAADFKPRDLVFSALEKNRQGGKQVFVSAVGNKSKIVIQTPAMHLPWGVSVYQDASTGTPQSWTLDLSFRDNEDFLKVVQEMDEVMLDVATQRSAEWFGKQMPRELVAEFYRPLVRLANNPQYAPTLKIKVPASNGHELARFFDEEKNPVPLEYVTKNSKVKVIAELSPVWFLNKQVGITWKAVQVAVVERTRNFEDFAFRDDEEDKENATTTPTPTPYLEI